MAKVADKKRELELRQMADATASAALATVGSDSKLLSAASSELTAMASRTARKSDKGPAVIIIDDNATQDELRTARRRQATRRGKDVYLPSWSTVARVLPSAFLRSALFSSSRSAAAANDLVLGEDESIMVSNKPIASFNNLSLTYSGYQLCQMDRIIYAACLDYYRDQPLTPISSDRKVTTTFYEFAQMMSRAYSPNLHISIRAGLLRLSLAQIRMRYEKANIEVPKLLSVSFVDGYTGNPDTNELRGSDLIQLTINEDIAGLFGPGCWTAVDADTAKRIDLLGWVTNFYATHSASSWLSVERLYELSGYESSFGGFHRSLIKVLEELKTDKAPAGSRVESYAFTNDKPLKVLVKMAAWSDKQA